MDNTLLKFNIASKNYNWIPRKLLKFTKLQINVIEAEIEYFTDFW